MLTTAEHRYLHDVVFHKLVDMLQKIIEEGQVSPTEIRDALVLALFRHELQSPLPMCISKKWFEWACVEKKEEEVR